MYFIIDSNNIKLDRQESILIFIRFFPFKPCKIIDEKGKFDICAFRGIIRKSTFPKLILFILLSSIFYIFICIILFIFLSSLMTTFLFFLCSIIFSLFPIIQGCPGYVNQGLPNQYWECCPGQWVFQDGVCADAQKGGYGDGINSIACSLGYYCPYIGMSFPFECPAGTYCPTYPRQLAIACPIGSICPFNKTINAVLCPSGFFCNTTGLANATGICPASTYCPTGSRNPTACPQGSYCPRDGLNNYIPCDPGYQCPFANMISVGDICPNGTYCPRGSIRPINCTIGRYCPFNGMNVSLLCSDGIYCPYNNTITPFPCLPGTYCPKLASNTSIGLLNYTQ